MSNVLHLSAKTLLLDQHVDW